MNVVLDIDGTVVFTEEAEIPIPGRSRHSYLSAKAASLLAEISNHSELYLATARSAARVTGLVSRLPNVKFAGFVLEGGLVSRHDIYARPAPHGAQRTLSRLIADQHPEWEVERSYEQMVCCVASSHPDPLRRVRELTAANEATRLWLSHSERHKTFVYPETLCKRIGLRNLGVQTIDFAAGDDAIYDASLLRAAAYPCTSMSADASIVSLVRQRGGWVSSKRSHEAAVDLLEHINIRLRPNIA